MDSSSASESGRPTSRRLEIWTSKHSVTEFQYPSISDESIPNRTLFDTGIKSWRRLTDSPSIFNISWIIIHAYACRNDKKSKGSYRMTHTWISWVIPVYFQEILLIHLEVEYCNAMVSFFQIWFLGWYIFGFDHQWSQISGQCWPLLILNFRWTSEVPQEHTKPISIRSVPKSK